MSGGVAPIPTSNTGTPARFACRTQFAVPGVGGSAMNATHLSGLPAVIMRALRMGPAARPSVVHSSVDIAYVSYGTQRSSAQRRAKRSTPSAPPSIRRVTGVALLMPSRTSNTVW